jgi:hypothetical protein
MSAAGRNAGVAWFTAAHDQLRVKSAFTNNSGETFGAPIAIDEGSPLGRVDALMIRPGVALVSWIEVKETGKIQVRRISSDGRMGDPITVSDTSASTSSGFPQMERIGNEVVIAWTAPGEPGAVKTAVLKIQ